MNVRGFLLAANSVMSPRELPFVVKKEINLPDEIDFTVRFYVRIYLHAKWLDIYLLLILV